MNRPLQLASRATLFAALMTLLAATIPGPAKAIQLRWGSGGTDLSATTSTRAMLVVAADSSEGTLPPTWRLQWTADTSAVGFTAVDSVLACQADTAQVDLIDPPSTPADSAANEITAHFCSDGSTLATYAYFLVDLVGGTHGKLKVVALDPSDPDSLAVLESNEVTFNGGIDGEFAPVLLRVSSTHETALLRVTAVGSGLGSVETMRVGAADDLWSVPLTVSQRSGTAVIATADVYVPLPMAIVRAGNETFTTGGAMLAPDNMDILEAASAGVDTILFRDPNPSVYPKDFAFHYNAVYDATDPAHPWKGYFHLLYIRNKKGLASPDSIIGHAWTDSLGKAWKVDTLAFRPSGVGWDKKKVWAPSLQQVGNLTYMFYTGVDSLGNQSIGHATTAMLGTTNISWARRATPTYTAAQAASWADATGHEVPGVVSFRDPFVMPDPDATNHPGQYLLFNVGEDASHQTHYVVGVARSTTGNLNAWTDLGSYAATEHGNLAVPGALESPLVVRDSLTGAWQMFLANAAYDDSGFVSTIFLTQTQGDSLTDRSVSAWPQRDSLFYYVGQDRDVIGWQACEHLQIGKTHFFAAYEGNGIAISRMHWDPATQKFIFVYPDVTSAPSPTASEGVRLILTAWRPGAPEVRFVVESGSTVAPHLTIYDAMGRAVRRLVNGRTLQGRAEIAWDCRDGSGSAVPSGMYFARMTGAGRAQVLRVPVIR